MPDVTALPDLVTPATVNDSLIAYDNSQAEGSRIAELKFSGDDTQFLNGEGEFAALILDPSITVVNASTYDLLVDDGILHVSYTGTGACTVTWPTAQIVNKRLIRIKDAGGNAGSNNITIATEGSQLIDGQSTYIINADYASVTIYAYGGHLFVV